MFCKECNNSNTCVTICDNVEKYLARFHGLRRELPVDDHVMLFLQEEHLRANKAVYEDRHSDFIAKLNERLDKLSNRQRFIIRLKFLKGLTTKQISRKLEITIPCAHLRLEFALKKLRAMQDEPEKI